MSTEANLGEDDIVSSDDIYCLLPLTRRDTLKVVLRQEDCHEQHGVLRGTDLARLPKDIVAL